MCYLIQLYVQRMKIHTVCGYQAWCVCRFTCSEYDMIWFQQIHEMYICMCVCAGLSSCMDILRVKSFWQSSRKETNGDQPLRVKHCCLIELFCLEHPWHFQFWMNYIDYISIVYTKNFKLDVFSICGSLICL